MPLGESLDTIVDGWSELVNAWHRSHIGSSQLFMLKTDEERQDEPVNPVIAAVQFIVHAISRLLIFDFAIAILDRLTEGANFLFYPQGPIIQNPLNDSRYGRENAIIAQQASISYRSPGWWCYQLLRLPGNVIGGVLEIAMVVTACTLGITAEAKVVFEKSVDAFRLWLGDESAPVDNPHAGKSWLAQGFYYGLKTGVMGIVGSTIVFLGALFGSVMGITREADLVIERCWQTLGYWLFGELGEFNYQLILEKRDPRHASAEAQARAWKNRNSYQQYTFLLIKDEDDYYFACRNRDEDLSTDEEGWLSQEAERFAAIQNLILEIDAAEIHEHEGSLIISELERKRLINAMAIWRGDIMQNPHAGKPWVTQAFHYVLKTGLRGVFSALLCAAAGICLSIVGFTPEGITVFCNTGDFAKSWLYGFQADYWNNHADKNIVTQLAYYSLRTGALGFYFSGIILGWVVFSSVCGITREGVVVANFAENLLLSWLFDEEMRVLNPHFGKNVLVQAGHYLLKSGIYGFGYLTLAMGALCLFSLLSFSNEGIAVIANAWELAKHWVCGVPTHFSNPWADASTFKQIGHYLLKTGIISVLATVVLVGGACLVGLVMNHKTIDLWLKLLSNKHTSDPAERPYLLAGAWYNGLKNINLASIATVTIVAGIYALRFSGTLLFRVLQRCCQTIRAGFQALGMVSLPNENPLVTKLERLKQYSIVNSQEWTSPVKRTWNIRGDIVTKVNQFYNSNPFLTGLWKDMVRTFSCSSKSLREQVLMNLKSIAQASPELLPSALSEEALQALDITIVRSADTPTKLSIQVTDGAPELIQSLQLFFSENSRKLSQLRKTHSRLSDQQFDMEVAITLKYALRYAFLNNSTLKPAHEKPPVDEYQRSVLHTIVPVK